jgi:hypothetical protein
LLGDLPRHPWHLDEQNLEKEMVYKKVFPGQNWVDGRLGKTMVEANKVVGSFLLTQKYFKSDNEFAQMLD